MSAKARPAFLLYGGLTCLLGLAFFLGGSGRLFADRIYLKKGPVLRGRVLSIGVEDYRFETSNGKEERVAKSEIIKVIFSRGKLERGYGKFFAGAFAGLGYAQNSLTLTDNTFGQSNSLESTHAPVSLGLEAGWQVLPYHLALSGGLEYNTSDFFKNEEASYNYLNVNFGLIYSLPIPRKWPRLLNNTHIAIHSRFLLSGSARFRHPSLSDEENAAIDADGLGFALRIGKEWYSSDWKVWGVALRYTQDRFQTPEQKVRAPALTPELAGVPIPGTPRQPIVDLETASKFSNIGIVLSFSYDSLK